MFRGTNTRFVPECPPEVALHMNDPRALHSWKPHRPRRRRLDAKRCAVQVRIKSYLGDIPGAAAGVEKAGETDIEVDEDGAGLPVVCGESDGACFAGRYTQPWVRTPFDFVASTSGNALHVQRSRPRRIGVSIRKAARREKRARSDREHGHKRIVKLRSRVAKLPPAPGAMPIWAVNRTAHQWRTHNHTRP